MKKIANKILILSIIAFAAVGCTSDMKYKEYAVTAPSGLLIPTTDYYVRLLAGEGQYLNFRWEPATTENGLLPQYEVVFYPSATGNEIYRYDAGMNTSVNITHKVLNTAAEKAGIDIEGEGDIYWSVIANNGLVQSKASETRRLGVTRMSGFSVIPEFLYITGSASEAPGLDMEALPMKKLDQEGMFQITTKLDAGGTYNFVDEDGTYYSYSGGLMNDTNEGIVPTPGVFRITVDMTTKSIVWNEVTVRYHFQHMQSENEEIPYHSNGTWQVEKFIKFAPATWGQDERFRFHVYYEGSESEMWACSEDDTPSRFSSINSVPVGYWNINVGPIDSDGYKYCWKWTDDCENKTVRITLDMAVTTVTPHMDLEIL